jgi:hypothetical protein
VITNIIGRISSDGSGTLKGSEYVNVEGTTTSTLLTGQYDVSSDCMAVLHITDDSGVQSNYRGAISSSGKMVQLMQVDTGTVISGTAYQQ